jgi:tetratricopeptide (TPR) repeat protein
MAIQQDPTNSDNYELRGNLNMLAGKPQAALSDMTKAISLFPNSRYYKDRASIYRAMGQNEAAEADLKKAASSNVDMKDLLKGF